MDDIRLNGHSGCQVLLRRGNDNYYVIKKSKDKRYNQRLEIQCQKQKCEHIGLFDSAKVYRQYYDYNNLFCFEMQYISGITLAEYMRTIQLNKIKDIADLFGAMIPNCMIYDKSAYKAFKKKVVDLKQIICIDHFAIYKAFAILQDYSWDYIMCSPCHGDLTLENMIVSQKQVVLIDYLDSFYDSWLIDFAKIFQDIEIYWHYRYEEKLENNLKIRLFSLRELLLSRLYRLKDGIKLINSMYHILLLNLLRIVPYAFDEKTKEFLLESISYTIQQIEKEMSKTL